MDSNFENLAHRISDEYRDLNGSAIEILEKPPSAIEFSRLVHVSRPVVIKGLSFPALDRWSNEYLCERMGNRPISVAATPNGFADAITRGPDGGLYFVEPAVETMTMKEFLETLDPHGSPSPSTAIHYLQSQNGNLFPPLGNGSENKSEFEPLARDVPNDIPWCTEALGQNPDAVNLWIGDERSITSIHSDPYENVYTVIRGIKHFFLVPPTDSWSLKEKYYPHAKYKRNPSSGTFVIVPSSDTPDVRWSSIENPELRDALPEEVSPIKVTLHAGETLYLPVGWWHYVRQSGLTIALNWWYDAEMRGMSWVFLNFLRNSYKIESGNKETADAP